MESQQAGRDAKGRFLKGVYPGGPGRPAAERERSYLDALITHCTPEKWAMVCERAVADAVAGDRHARRWLSDYLLGPAVRKLELRHSGADGITAADQARTDIAEILERLRERKAAAIAGNGHSAGGSP